MIKFEFIVSRYNYRSTHCVSKDTLTKMPLFQIGSLLYDFFLYKVSYKKNQATNLLYNR